MTVWNRRWRRSVAVLMFLAVACGDDTSRPVSTASGASYLIPGSSLADWKSYGTFIAVLEVTAEHELPANTSGTSGGDPPAGGDELPAPQSYSIGRTVEVTVERVLWAGQDVVPERLTFTTDGWWWSGEDQERLPHVPSDGPRLEVGRRYIASMAEMAEGKWAVQTAAGALPLVGDRVQLGDGHGGPEELDGKTVDEVAAAISDTQAHPLAEEYRHLPPRQRWERVTQGSSSE